MTAILTGEPAAKGVGAAIVTVLREAGARVPTTAREGAEEAGVSTADGCAAVAKAARTRLGNLDNGHDSVESSAFFKARCKTTGRTGLSIKSIG